MWLIFYWENTVQHLPSVVVSLTIDEPARPRQKGFMDSLLRRHTWCHVTNYYFLATIQIQLFN